MPPPAIIQGDDTSQHLIQSVMSSGAAASQVMSGEASPVLSGAVSSGILSPGFLTQDSLSVVQESVYIVIGHGPYQYRVLLCGVLATMVALLHILSGRLLERPVDHWCSPPEDFRDMSADAWKNMSVPREADGTFSKCTMYDPAVMDRPDANRSVVQCHAWDYDIESIGDSAVSRLNLVCNRLYLSGVRELVAISASIIASPLLGWASDRLGRRPVMLLAVFLLLAGTIASSTVETVTFYICTRVVIFVGFNGTFLLTFIILYEVTGDAWRPLFTLTHTAIASVTVPPVVEAVASLRPHWARSQAFILVPTATLAALCFLLQESPAWLLATRHTKLAEAAVIAAAQMNGMDKAKAEATFETIRRQLRKMDRSRSSQVAIAAAAEQFLHAAKTHRRATSVFLARFSLSIVYFTLVRTRLAWGLYWEMLDTAVLFAVLGAAAWAMVKFNIRDTLSLALIMVCVGSTLEILLTSVGYSTVVRFAQLGTKTAVTVAMCLAYCYSAEIFPTDIRSGGVSLCLASNSAGSLMGVILVAYGGHNEYTYIAFCAVSAVLAALSVWAIHWLPEVFVRTPSQVQRVENAMNDKDRKEALKKSLSPTEGQRKRKRRKRKVISPTTDPR